MYFRVLRKLRGPDDIPPIIKQIPIAVFFFAAAALSSVIPTLTVTSWPVLVSGMVVICAATGLAVICGRPSLSRFAPVVPVLDFVAAGFLRSATGGSNSIYPSLVLLPVVWFALEGRRFVLFSVLGAGLASLIPFVLVGTRVSENPNELVRVLYSTLVFVFTAAVVNELAARARRRLGSARDEAAASAEELCQAAEIQRFLLPDEVVVLPGYETAGGCLPSKAVGGDFFDWYPIDGGLGFTLGDVMGKGAGAGMIAAATRAIIRSDRDSEDPGTALRATSDFLARDLSRAAAFATLFHARLRAADGRVLFSDAGHGLTLLVRADGSYKRLASREIPAGVLADTSWKAFEVRLDPGDMIVCFSDGVLDLYDGTLSAIEEVALLGAAAGSAQDIVDAVTRRAAATTNSDDVTILAVRRTAQRAPAGRTEEQGTLAASGSVVNG